MSTFGTASRRFKLSESVELSAKRKLKASHHLRLSLNNYERRALLGDSGLGQPGQGGSSGTRNLNGGSSRKGTKSTKKKIDYKILGVEKTPGPASYLLPSDFGYMVELKKAPHQKQPF